MRHDFSSVFRFIMRNIFITLAKHQLYNYVADLEAFFSTVVLIGLRIKGHWYPESIQLQLERDWEIQDRAQL